MKLLFSPNLPEAIGPYSHAVAAGPFLFISGQVPFHPKTGEVVGSTMAEQAKQALTNLTAILAEAGLTLHDVVKTTCYVSDLTKFAEFNAVYAEFMGDHRPARATVEVARLANDIYLEVEAIALLK
ncbi:MAG: Rid family detoxifying hydrolase [Deltaproteobacteria bacterium]|jgi:2-iminobutanoate/2-iminopropanoate deaminase|nr:Rid family detoxifying hydrolase [Deltaproteobacteria bacterium]